ncbi:MAG: cyclopropane fatty acyl phospholipid synthase [Gammaproteobacteria bacterium]
MSTRSLAIPSKIRTRGFKEKFSRLLQLTDVELNGNRPWDIRVHDPRFYARVFADGALGLGESYIDEWWDCEQVDEFIHRVLWAQLHTRIKPWKEVLDRIRATLLNLQNQARAYDVGRRHYDIGNELYERMLDKRMLYSCGYWKNATTLDEAQEAKLDLVCRKLRLAPGMRVLDIGCGWGGAARFVAEHYRVDVVGITVSEQQATRVRELCQGLPVEVYLQDYRAIQGRFDRAYSLGMFEHVGHKNYGTYMQVVSEHLQEEGIFVLQTVGANDTDTTGNLWAERYIFPNSMLPSARQITVAIEGRFVLEDWQNFGPDYDTTLMHWFKNFNQSWETLKSNYDERFYRIWKYYLLSFAGAFRARHIQLWQIVLSPRGGPARYDAPR